MRSELLWKAYSIDIKSTEEDTLERFLWLSKSRNELASLIETMLAVCEREVEEKKEAMIVVSV